MFTLESIYTSQSKGLLIRVSVPIPSSECASRALAVQGVAHRLHPCHRDDGDDDGGDGAQKKLCPELTLFL
jgi:hypothetical protein